MALSEIGLESEKERLRTLRDHNLLDTPPEDDFDGFVTVAAEFMKAPMAFFSLVDNSRVWFKSRVGSDAEEVSRECSFCGYSAENDEILIVEDAQQDSRFAASPLVSGPPHVRFYVGVPIHATNGHALGTLCILDIRRRVIRTEELRVLQSLARAMETQLELRQMLVEQQDLFEERAVLTDMIMHDASGVVAVIRWSLGQLEKNVGDRMTTLAHCQSASDELLRLCESVLNTDRDRPRAISVERKTQDLRPWLDSVGRRLKGIAGDENISVAVTNELPGEPIETDVHLLERIIMNLVRNSIEACSSGSTINIGARQNDETELVFNVAEDGPGIPEEELSRIFDPYVSSRRTGSGGAGLGLTICRKIVWALDGSITVQPRESGAEFEVVVPTAAKSNGLREQRI